MKFIEATHFATREAFLAGVAYARRSYEEERGEEIAWDRWWEQTAKPWLLEAEKGIILSKGQVK